MYTDLTTLCVSHRSTFGEAVAQMDRSRLGIVLVVDEERRLVGTVTDGDVRRAMLDRIGMDQPVAVLLARKAGTHYAKPITAPVGADREQWRSLLRQEKILHLPLVDTQQRVAGLVTLDDFAFSEPLLRAVVMAGGPGSRLSPLTEETPKPMLPVGGRPLLEIIIGQLREAGIKHVKVTTHHKPEKIAEHFGTGKEFGVELSYATEDRPLGTVGGLGLLEPPTETTLVINGDILTQVDLRAMRAYHREHHADLTMAVRRYEIQVPYGVVECKGPTVQGVNEKPMLDVFVNAGIYLLEPVVYRFIPTGQRFDMTELIQRLLADRRTIVSFPIREYWLDIGQQSDYERAQQDVVAWSGGRHDE